MTDKDLRLIDEASKVRMNHIVIADMIKEAESEEARSVLREMEREAFIRHERACGDTI